MNTFVFPYTYIDTSLHRSWCFELRSSNLNDEAYHLNQRKLLDVDRQASLPHLHHILLLLLLDPKLGPRLGLSSGTCPSSDQSGGRVGRVHHHGLPQLPKGQHSCAKVNRQFLQTIPGTRRKQKLGEISLLIVVLYTRLAGKCPSFFFPIFFFFLFFLILLILLILCSFNDNGSGRQVPGVRPSAIAGSSDIVEWPPLPPLIPLFSLPNPTQPSSLFFSILVSLLNCN